MVICITYKNKSIGKMFPKKTDLKKFIYGLFYGSGFVGGCFQTNAFLKIISGLKKGESFKIKNYTFLILEEAK